MLRKSNMRLAAMIVAVTLAASACTNATTTTSPAPPATAESSVTATTLDGTPEPALTTDVQPTRPAFQDNRLSTIDADLEGALLGIATGPNARDRIPRFQQIEADSGRQLDIGHVFHSWDTAIPTADDLFHLEAGRILMLSWNGNDTIEIQNGRHDAWIGEQATAVRDLGEPVLMRWLWEMDGQRRIDWVHSPEDFVAAWLHVRSIFDEVGASNADFVWCPNAHLFWPDGGDPDAWYPGDDHVDWICADGYNWPDTTASEQWVSLDSIFEDFVAWAEPHDKPIMIGETGSNEAESGAKAAWIESLPGVLQGQLPAVDALVYFDTDFRANGDPNWQVDTSVDSYDAWIDAIQDPWLNP